MAAVPDASPLIALGKIERVDLLAKLFGQVLITPKIWEEAVVQGKAIGARDAAYLEKLERSRLLRRVRATESERQVAERLRSGEGIALGEAEVLAVARSRGAIAVVDEKAARAVAVGLGVVHIGTLGVVYRAFQGKLLTYDQLIELLEQLGRVAWISPDLLARIIRDAREGERK